MMSAFGRSKPNALSDVLKNINSGFVSQSIYNRDIEIERLNHKIAELNKEIIELTDNPEAPVRVDLLIENQDLKKKLKKAKEFINMMQSQTADLNKRLK